MNKYKNNTKKLNQSEEKMSPVRMFICVFILLFFLFPATFVFSSMFGKMLSLDAELYMPYVTRPIFIIFAILYAVGCFIYLVLFYFAHFLGWLYNCLRVIYFSIKLHASGFQTFEALVQAFFILMFQSEEFGLEDLVSRFLDNCSIAFSGDDYHIGYELISDLYNENILPFLFNRASDDPIMESDDFMSRLVMREYYFFTSESYLSYFFSEFSLDNVYLDENSRITTFTEDSIIPLRNPF
jgi:hypothetical protein